MPVILGASKGFPAEIKAPMKLKFNSRFRLVAHSFSAAAVLVIASGAQAQNLIESDYSGEVIYSFTPAGARSVFAPFLDRPAQMAFNSEGDLFVGEGNVNILEFTPGGMKSTFATGLLDPSGLAFNSAGNLF